MRCAILIFMAIITSPPIRPAFAQALPRAEQYLIEGRLAEGEEALSAYLQANDDDEARFGLASVQLVRGVERLMQSLYAHGMRTNSGIGGLPFLRLPVPENPEPQPMKYETVREILTTFSDDLKRTEATLAQVKSRDVRMPLRFGLVRLDFNGDGQAGDDETLWKIYSRVQRANIDAQQAESFVVTLDAGDVQWLRGYCHLLMAVCDIALGHDGKELFERTAHVFFMNPQTSYPFLQSGRKVADLGMGFDIVDAIAAIHLMHFPVTEPQGMQSALAHLQEMLARSRESWKLIMAEQDDEHEWIPNPDQSSVIPDVQVTPEMIESWNTFLDEADALLAGRVLVPFWRGDGTKGVNIRRVFTEPTTFDLVLWVQGTAAAPYLEEGEITSQEVWQQMQRAFRGNLFGFAVWFN